MVVHFLYKKLNYGGVLDIAELKYTLMGQLLCNSVSIRRGFVGRRL